MIVDVDVREEKENSSPSSMGKSLKNTIRSLTRLLSRPLPEEVKQRKQQELEALKAKETEGHKHRRERKVTRLYEKVKFVESRKVIRRIAKLEKRLKQEEDAERRSVEEELEIARRDLEYVTHYPKDAKYVSLFRGQDDPEHVARQEAMRRHIQEEVATEAKAKTEIQQETEDDFFLPAPPEEEETHRSQPQRRSRPKKGPEEKKEKKRRKIQA